MIASTFQILCSLFDFINLNGSDFFFLETVDAFKIFAFGNGELILVFFVCCVLVDHVKFLLEFADDETFVELSQNVKMLEIVLLYAPRSHVSQLSAKRGIHLLLGVCLGLWKHLLVSYERCRLGCL